MVDSWNQLLAFLVLSQQDIIPLVTGPFKVEMHFKYTLKFYPKAHYVHPIQYVLGVV